MSNPLEEKPDKHLSFVERTEKGELYFHLGIDEFCYLPENGVKSRIEPDPKRECERCGGSINAYHDTSCGDFVFTCEGDCANRELLKLNNGDSKVPHFWVLEGLEFEQEENPYKHS